MFGFLKDKLKSAIKTFSKSAESDIKEEKVEVPIQKEKTSKEKVPKPAEQKTEQKKQEQKTEVPKKVEEKKPTPVVKKPEPKIESKPEPKVEPKKVPVIEKKETVKEEKEKLPEKKTEKIPETKHIPKVQEIVKETKKEEPKKETKETPIKTKEVVKEQPKKQPQEEKKEEIKQEKKGFFGKLFGKRDEKPKEEKVVEKESEPAVKIEEKLEEEIAELEAEQEVSAEEDISDEETQDQKETEDKQSEEDEEETEEPAEEKKGFFGKLTEALTKRTLTQEKFDELFWELEVAMLENNVAVEVIEKIKNNLKDELTTGKVSRGGIEDMIKSRLRQSVEELFDVETFNLISKIKSAPKPYKICIIGVNGSGKTTTLAKIIHLLQQNKLSVVVAASDTFRAAAIDQLREHTDKLGVKLISQGYGADPAAVAYDAIEHAKSKNIDVVLIDTAGRLHSNTNLMQELEKVVRVNKPDLKLFIGEAITGNDCVEQATVFNKLVGIDAMILSKADIDEKGGAAISVSFVTGKPILYFGVGQRYEDLIPFDKEKIIDSLDL